VSEVHLPFRLDGRVALVTGSSRGLGRGIALALGRAGAKVALNYANSEATAQAALDAFQSTGGTGMLVRADVTDEQDIARAVRQVNDELGPIDILVCNATCDQPLKPVDQYDWAFVQRMLDFFVKSPFLLTQAVLPSMRERGWGRIINITSEVFQIGSAPFSAYVAAKGGQVGLCRSLARELAPTGVTVNMVAPGWVPVERHENDPPEAKAAYLSGIPMARFGIPDDVAGAVLYLASQEAAFVTGQTITVNGGLTVN
jgi:3-oxoacyl-[acyl-carrier protein] reductase